MRSNGSYLDQPEPAIIRELANEPGYYSIHETSRKETFLCKVDPERGIIEIPHKGKRFYVDIRKLANQAR